MAKKSTDGDSEKGDEEHEEKGEEVEILPARPVGNFQ